MTCTYCPNHESTNEHRLSIAHRVAVLKALGSPQSNIDAVLAENN